MCLLLSDELVARFTWHKHLSANDSQELCSFDVMMHAQPAPVQYKSKLVLSFGSIILVAQSAPSEIRTLWHPILERTGSPVCYNLSTPEEMYKAENWEYGEKNPTKPLSWAIFLTNSDLHVWYESAQNSLLIHSAKETAVPPKK